MRDIKVFFFTGLIFTLLALCVNKPVYCQQYSYDEIIGSLSGLTDNQAYSRLFEYRSQYPKEANVYLQLAHITEQIINHLDPFKDFAQVNFQIDNAVTYLNLFPVYLTDNEVKRNRKYYANVPVEAAGFTFTNEGVLEYTKSKVEHYKKVKKSLADIYATIGESKDHYNNCIRIFNEISNQYANYNEVLLKTDDKFLAKLNNLDNEFKATIKAFDAYKLLLKDFKLGHYNQQYKLVPIKTFRLDGITNSDFLQPEFSLWDFGNWITDFKAVYEKDIVGLRKEVANIQMLFQSNIDSLNKSDYNSETKLNSFDDYFMFKLGRFDSNSLIRELFNYCDKRQTFLASAKNPLNNSRDSSSALLYRKLRYYYRLAQDEANAKQALEVFNGSVTAEKVSRFNDFFTEYYGGFKGLNNYKADQGSMLNNSFDEALDNLENYLSNEKWHKENYASAGSKKGVQISLVPNAATASVAQNAYITEDVFYSSGKPRYISGYQVKAKTNVAFVAKIGNGGKIEWIKNIESNNPAINGFNRTAPKILGYEKGLMALVTTHIEGDQLTGGDANKLWHTLVRLDTMGNIKQTSELSNSPFPLQISYDEINQISHLVFGKKATENDIFYSGISICQIDSAGEVNWNVEVNVKGTLAGFVRTDNQYTAYINYQEYEWNGKKEIAGNDGKNWAFLMVGISDKGKISFLKPVVAAESFYIEHVFSLSSNEVNLLGYSGAPDKMPGRFRYFVCLANGDLKFSSIDLK